MNNPMPLFHSNAIILVAMISFWTSVLLHNPGQPEVACVPEIKRSFEGESILPLASGGDFLGFYSTFQSPSPNPYPIDVVSFASLNGGSTTLSNSLSTINFIQTGNFLPTNTSAYNPASKQLVCLLSGEEQMLTYDDNPMNSNLINVGALTATAPVFLQSTYYGILVENGGYASGPVVDFELASIDYNTGLMNGVAPFQFSPGNPGFYAFTHETMSSATNRIDELYFLSGTNLIIIQNPNPSNPNMCWIDLAPSNTPSNYAKFYGLEYRSPGVVMAIRESFLNGNMSATALVQITFNSTTCNVIGMTVLFDMMTNLMPTPAGWVFNSEYYSTTFDSCAQRYYISSLYDMASSSRLVEIDLQSLTHAEQTFPEYLFGIEWKHKPCPCAASFAVELIDSCQSVQFINTSSGSNLSYTWNFDDLQSGPNNTSSLLNPTHQFTTCGQYNVCMTVSGPGCDTTICQLITLMDAVSPVALCKSNLTLVLDANCMAVLQVSDVDNGSFDNCLLQSLSISQSVFNACGEFPVTLTATDWCGNISQCMTMVEVTDNSPPLIICPLDMYVATTGQNCSKVVNGIKWIAIADNCGTPSVTYTITGASNFSGNGDASGLTFLNGTSIVTYTAADDCGNTASCSFKVVVDCICNCPGNMVKNPGFNQGAVMGNFGTGGQINDWFRRTETPYIDASSFCCDPFSMYFWGVVNYGESIYQPGFNFIAGHTYKISFCSKSNLRFGFTATQSPIMQFFYPYNCINCEDMGTSVQAIATVWAAYTLPLWTAAQNADLMYIRGLGTGTSYLNTGRMDNLCIVEVSYTCCGDHKAFMDNSINIVNVYEDQERKEAVFEVGYLLGCNSIGYINWGDGTDTIGPIEGNTILRHAYPENKSYPISYQIQESTPGDTSQTVCFENILYDTITIEPDTCYCNLFSGMVLRSDDISGREVICGDGPIVLECPLPGKPLSFTGGFYCNGFDCVDNNVITWVLSGPSGVYVDSTAANPYFSINIPPLYISQPGVYTISLYGQCGDQTCICEIQFSMDCPDLCSCTLQDIQAFDAAVDQGFSIARSSNSCKACFAPVAVSDCETVSWFINDVMGSPIGASVGTQSFCYSFPDPGTYIIIMVVSRKNADGTDCQTVSKTQIVTISCQPWTPCTNTLIDNATFSEGAVAGGFHSGGTTQGWTSLSGEPVVIEGAQGSEDGWTIQLTGNLDSADILVMSEPVCLTRSKGVIKSKNKVEHWGDPHENLNGKHVKDWEGKHRLFIGDISDVSECNGMDCFELGSINYSLADTGWIEYQIPYDLSLWLDADSCTSGGGGDQMIEARLAIFVTSPHGNNQGGIEARARIQIDDICFDETLVSVPTTQDIMSFRIYPNPNSGQFTIELSQPAKQGSSIRVVGLAGNVLLENQVSIGSMVQTIDASAVPQGMYFLQFISKDQVLVVDKFVRQ